MPAPYSFSSALERAEGITGFRKREIEGVAQTPRYSEEIYCIESMFRAKRLGEKSRPLSILVLIGFEIDFIIVLST